MRRLAKGTLFATASSSLNQTRCTNLFVAHAATLLLTNPCSCLISISAPVKLQKSGQLRAVGVSGRREGECLSIISRTGSIFIFGADSSRTGVSALHDLFFVLIPVLRRRLGRIGCARDGLLQIDRRQSCFLQLLVQLRNVFRLELAPRGELVFQRLFQFHEHCGLLGGGSGVGGVESVEDRA